MDNLKNIILAILLSIGVVQLSGSPQNFDFRELYSIFYSYPTHSHQAPVYDSNPAPFSSGTCGDLWSYQTDDYGDKIGMVKVKYPVKYPWQNSTIQVILTVAAQINRRNTASVELAKSEYSSNDDIQQGRPLLYRVNFPIQNPLPQIHEVYYNHQLLCSAPKVFSNFVTILKLGHSWTTPLGTETVYRPPSPFRTTTIIPGTIWDYKPDNSFRPTIHRTTTRIPATSNADEFKCGISDFVPSASQSLIINGENVKRSQYPWLAVLYRNSQTDVSGIFCGGSLISRKLVVTAAHCIRDKYSELATKAEDVTIFLGKLNMETMDSEPGHVMSSVQEIIVHPHWNHLTDNYDADIAVAVLEKSFRFTRNIRPICLPTTTESFEDLVGRKVVIAGWGKTETNALSTSVPKWAEITVIDTRSCLESNRVYGTMTSGRTFCAGDDSSISSRVSGSGPCSGDSGGGLTIKINGTWYLRGIISSTVKAPDTNFCDPQYFSVFTDVAKFRSWLQKQMKAYR